MDSAVKVSAPFCHFNAMTDTAVIIHAKNDKLHIKRCFERIAALSPRQVFVVDCFSTDGTQRIVEEWKSG